MKTAIEKESPGNKKLRVNDVSLRYTVCSASPLRPGRCHAVSEERFLAELEKAAANENKTSADDGRQDVDPKP
ncbi:hypothetical protein PLESTB_001605300 [Pleodorina starrii]|uniref:Uncharacterized protein n=1 Tax=Pleodorina starrii TaxID=330485 RepID=A0A9W6F8I0_9CHLO|nr:hypothetical protein PLESTB_001605300 [Pleodorina starrii]